MTRSTVPSARRYPSVPSSAKRLLTSFAHFQSSSVFLLFIRVHDTFRQMDPECFLLRGLPFHVLGGVNQSPEAFHLDEVHFISVFFFYASCFSCAEKSLSAEATKNFYLLEFFSFWLLRLGL